jgi:hypothetical protein
MTDNIIIIKEFLTGLIIYTAVHFVTPTAPGGVKNYEDIFVLLARQGP